MVGISAALLAFLGLVFGRSGDALELRLPELAAGQPTGSLLGYAIARWSIATRRSGKKFKKCHGAG